MACFLFTSALLFSAEGGDSLQNIPSVKFGCSAEDLWCHSEPTKNVLMDVQTVETFRDWDVLAWSLIIILN